MNSFVVVESPFAGDAGRNQVYLQRIIRELSLNSYSTYASHRMLTGALDDNNVDERRQGMLLGAHMTRKLLDAGASHLFCVAYGMSEGMQESARLHRRHEWCYVTTDARKFIRTTYTDLLRLYW